MNGKILFFCMRFEKSALPICNVRLFSIISNFFWRVYVWGCLADSLQWWSRSVGNIYWAIMCHLLNRFIVCHWRNWRQPISFFYTTTFNGCRNKVEILLFFSFITHLATCINYDYAWHGLMMSLCLFLWWKTQNLRK